MTEPFSDRIERFVRMLRASGSCHKPEIQRVVRDTPRHYFIDQFYRNTKRGPRLTRIPDTGPTPSQLDRIYSDVSLSTHRQPPSSSSQPSLVTDMLQMLDLKRGHRVLEIGAGTGWNAALMSRIVGDEGHVTTVDIQTDVTRRARRHLRRARCSNVTVITGDGYRGHASTSPYDRLITTVSTPSVPGAWIDQIELGGTMLVVLQETSGDGWDLLLKLKKTKTGMVGAVAGLAGFMTLTGKLSAARTTVDEMTALYPGIKPRRVHAPWTDFSGSVRHRVHRDFLFFAQLDGFELV